MVSWKWALALVGVAAVIGAYLLLSRPRPTPPAPPLVPCGVLNTVYLQIQGQGQTLELERGSPGARWQIAQPVNAAADSSTVDNLVNQVNGVEVLNTISSPQPISQYGLSQPKVAVTCRVKSGRSYNLTVGNQSFDGSGYYAQKGGDNRVFVISSVEVDGFDRALSSPPVEPTPSP
ncbi:MAG: DUF4340 domain-containing protein, partial [Candidatus Dormibacteraeota bacterium]|nr:DUF4340 domain-containing protein [Candidatus Dormibacteraeota bacterium]